jgi:hypothetical protein
MFAKEDGPEKVYTIEQHGKDGEYVIYKGRNSNQHGLNLCTLSNISDFDVLFLEMVINGVYKESEVASDYPYTLEYYGPEGVFALYKNFYSYSKKPMAIVSDIDYKNDITKYMLTCLNIHAARMERPVEKFNCFCGELVNVEEHNESDHTWYSIKCPKCISSATGPDLSIIDRWKQNVQMEKEQYNIGFDKNDPGVILKKEYQAIEELNNRFNALVKRLGLENDSSINGKKQ